MKVACPSCGRIMTVPPDKVALPRLKGRCPCGTEFAVTGPAAAGNRAPAPLGPPPEPPDPRTSAGPPSPPPVARLPAPSPPADSIAPPRVPTRPVPWPRCANHPQVRSSFVCPKCVKGYCDGCVQKVQGAAICAGCDGLCVPTEQYGQKQDMVRQRDRTMAEDVALIVGYPLKDPLAFVLLALFTWFFGHFAAFLAQGVLMLYTFHALTRVSNGDFKSSMPDFTDVYDLMQPARLAIAAFVISTGPLIAVTLLVPGAHVNLFGGRDAPSAVVHAAQEPPAPAPDAEADDEDDPDAEASPAGPDRNRGGSERRHRDRWKDEESIGAGAVALLAITLLWKLAYTPVALTVAALSRSYLSTLNPVIGIGTIARMGATYWHAMAIYTALALAQWALGFGLDRIPLAGPLIRSFTDAYAQLAIACTLGLAVFKKAKALGWD